jgi:outer membrane protein assembly factor BamD (BamD/ComL family)
VSIIGILSSNLFSGGAAQNTLQTQSAQKNTPKFEQIKTEFQQLGQDLQSGNLTQAQTDYAALAADFPGASQLSAAASTSTADSPAGPTTGAGTVAQQFAQLGQDLKAGNLQAAQQDFTNIQRTTEQTAQQNGTQQTGGHHHRHHQGGETQSASSTSSSQQSNAINQAFSTLSQDLTAGNLSGAQSAFATLQNDLQQIGGFISSGSSPTSTGSSSAIGGSLNVNA